MHHPVFWLLCPLAARCLQHFKSLLLHFLLDQVEKFEFAFQHYRFPNLGFHAFLHVLSSTAPQARVLVAKIP